MSLKEGETNKELFQRFCRDMYTRADLKTIFKWFESNQYDLVRRISMKHWWKTFELPDFKEEDPTYDPELMLDKIHHQLNLEKAAATKRKTPYKDLKKIYNVFSRAAAILIIPLLLVTLYMYINPEMVNKDQSVSYSEVFAPKNSRLKIQLPDGTQAWLNHGSSLRYPQFFTEKTRTVRLSGEAYFDVSRDPSHPFYVKTHGVDIEVKGTSFNVSACRYDKKIVTTVEEGRVMVHGSGLDGCERRVVELTASQQSSFFKYSAKNQVKYVNPEKYTGWKDGKLMLIDDPMANVEKKLERWYNVEIEIQDSKVYDYKYTATFRDESIEQVMKYLSLAAPISYEIRMGEKRPDNSFTRKKVIIKKK